MPALGVGHAPEPLPALTVSTVLPDLSISAPGADAVLRQACTPLRDTDLRDVAADHLSDQGLQFQALFRRQGLGHLRLQPRELGIFHGEPPGEDLTVRPERRWCNEFALISTFNGGLRLKNAI